jgi:hypothetical protein
MRWQGKLWSTVATVLLSAFALAATYCGWTYFELRRPQLIGEWHSLRDDFIAREYRYLTDWTSFEPPYGREITLAERSRFRWWPPHGESVFRWGGCPGDFIVHWEGNERLVVECRKSSRLVSDPEWLDVRQQESRWRGVAIDYRIVPDPDPAP